MECLGATAFVTDPGFQNTRHPPELSGRALREALAPSLLEKSYHGRRAPDGIGEVWVEESKANAVGDTVVCGSTRRPLPLCLELRNHSPTGFAWGYGGSGPAQLALALLMDAIGNEELALTHYQDFKREHVSNWGERWSITAREIRAFVAQRQNGSGP